MRHAACGMRNERRAIAGYGYTLSSLIFFLILLPFAASAELIDRVVASVNNEAITFSELNQAVSFNIAVGGGSTENLREQTLEGLINRRLLTQEAYRLKFVEVSEQDIDTEIEKLKKRLGPDAALADFLTRLDITAGQLRRMLRERLLVERFIEKKIGLFIRVSREEAQDFFNRNAARFKGRRFQEVQKEITAGLQEQKLEEQMSQYLAELKSKADVRMNL